MAYNDKIGFDLPSKVPDFFGGLTSHQFGHGIEAQLFQSGNAPIALLARQCGAKVFLLSVLADDGTFLLAEVALAGTSVRLEDDFTEIAPSRSAVRPSTDPS